jgi:uncharacterized membrane protein
MKKTENHLPRQLPRQLPRRLIHAVLAGIYTAAALGVIDKTRAAGLAAGCYDLLAIV